MTENKRYFSVDYDEEYYIFDSTKISKEEVLEKAEYSYDVFGDSLMGDDVVNLLNENEQLKSELRKQSKQCTESIVRIKEENEELKEEIQNLTIDIHDACERIEEKDNLIKDLEKW